MKGKSYLEWAKDTESIIKNKNVMKGYGIRVGNDPNVIFFSTNKEHVEGVLNTLNEQNDGVLFHFVEVYIDDELFDLRAEYYFNLVKE